jgi:hypothetical protein
LPTDPVPKPSRPFHAAVEKRVATGTPRPGHGRARSRRWQPRRASVETKKVSNTSLVTV